ncbi:hypothetical protein ACQ9AK_10485, partial [Escherichia coli]|uniref:hypothetical protein n=1 Tax=Escherichia coli TaxID=562 RepID=UPI003D36FFF7
SLKTSIKTITYLSDTGCLEIQGASLCSSIRYSYLEKFVPQFIIEFKEKYIENKIRAIARILLF